MTTRKEQLLLNAVAMNVAQATEWIDVSEMDQFAFPVFWTDGTGADGQPNGTIALEGTYDGGTTVYELASTAAGGVAGKMLFAVTVHPYKHVRISWTPVTALATDLLSVSIYGKVDRP